MPEPCCLKLPQPPNAARHWRLGRSMDPGGLQELFRSLAGASARGNGAALTSWIHRDAWWRPGLALGRPVDGVFKPGG